MKLASTCTHAHTHTDLAWLNYGELFKIQATMKKKKVNPLNILAQQTTLSKQTFNCLMGLILDTV